MFFLKDFQKGIGVFLGLKVGFFSFPVFASQISFGNIQNNLFSFPNFFDQSIELILQILRGGSIFFVLIFIQTLLLGTFRHMTSRGKNEAIHEGRHRMVKGVIGILMMLVLFFVTSTWH